MRPAPGCSGAYLAGPSRSLLARARAPAFARLRLAARRPTSSASLLLRAMFAPRSVGPLGILGVAARLVPTLWSSLAFGSLREFAFWSSLAFGSLRELAFWS